MSIELRFDQQENEYLMLINNKKESRTLRL